MGAVVMVMDLGKAGGAFWSMIEDSGILGMAGWRVEVVLC